MAKGFLIGDIHLGLHQLTEDKWIKIAEEYFDNFFIPKVLEKWVKGDKIFILGDLFDNRNHLTLRIISFALDLFNKFEKNNLEVVLITGNHDLRNNNDALNTSVRILERYPMVEIFTESKIYEFSNKKILLMPWINVLSEQKAIMKKYSNQVDYLFTHSDLRGAKTNLKNSVIMHGATIADFVAYPKVYASHIHLYQKIDNFTYLGNPFHMDRNDKGNKKGITILDFDNNTESFIENDYSPQYITVEIKEESDFEKIDNSKKGDFIDIIVNNSTIINNKGIRKKLEDLSKKQTIATIKQIDDINIDNVDLDLEKLDIDFSIEDMLRNYITTQNIDNNLLNKMMLTFDECIKICKFDGKDE